MAAREEEEEEKEEEEEEEEVPEDSKKRSSLLWLHASWQNISVGKKTNFVWEGPRGRTLLSVSLKTQKMVQNLRVSGVVHHVTLAGGHLLSLVGHFYSRTAVIQSVANAKSNLTQHYCTILRERYEHNTSCGRNPPRRRHGACCNA